MDDYSQSTLDLIETSLMEIDFTDKEISNIITKIKNNDIEIDRSLSIRNIRRMILEQL